MSHSYIACENKSLRIDDVSMVVAGYFLCDALKALSSSANYDACALIRRLPKFEHAFVYNGPGASFIVLDEYLSDEKSRGCFRLAVESAKLRVASFGATISKDFLSVNIPVKAIAFGIIPSQTIIGILTEVSDLVPKGK